MARKLWKFFGATSVGRGSVEDLTTQALEPTLGLEGVLSRCVQTKLVSLLGGHDLDVEELLFPLFELEGEVAFFVFPTP